MTGRGNMPPLLVSDMFRVTRDSIGPCDTIHYIMSPSGPYFPQGLRQVSLLIIRENVRPWPGGTGGHKLGENYSPGFLSQQIASSQGYNQVLWFFGKGAQVTEAGRMNFIVVVKRKNGDGKALRTRYISYECHYNTMQATI